MLNIKKFLNLIKCPICESSRYKTLANSKYKNIKSKKDLLNLYKSSADEKLVDQIVECKNCKLIYLNPRISSKIINKGYEDVVDNLHAKEDYFRYKTFNYSLNKILKYLNISNFKDKKFLDIGSASGIFLKVLKDKKFEESGVEPSKWLANFGKKKYKVNLNQGNIFQIKNQKYDFISLWDVLEHVTDLNKTLKKIQKISHNNSYIIINVPAVDTLACKILRKNWPFYLNVHLYYFTDQTLCKIFKKYNFKCLYIKPHWQFLSLGYALYRGKKYFSILNYVLKIIKFLKLENMPFKYNLGQKTYIFKKIEK